MNLLTFALLTSSIQAGPLYPFFTDAQIAKWDFVAENYTTTGFLCKSDNAKGQTASKIDVTGDEARSYYTACARRCNASKTCIGFSSSESKAACIHVINSATTPAAIVDTTDAEYKCSRKNKAGLVITFNRSKLVIDFYTELKVLMAGMDAEFGGPGLGKVVGGLFETLLKTTYDNAIAERDKDTTITEAQKRNWQEEFIGLTLDMLADIIGPDAKKASGNYGLYNFQEVTSPESEFRKIYKALKGDTLTKVDQKIKSVLFNFVEGYHFKQLTARIDARTAGKYYQKTLADYLKLTVQEKSLLDTGLAIMPFAPKGVINAYVADMDTQQDTYIRAQGAAGLLEPAEGKGKLSITQYLAARFKNLALDAGTLQVRKLIMDQVKALPTVTQANYAQQLTTLKASVSQTLRAWEKYTSPKGGEQGFNCAFMDPDALTLYRPPGKCTPPGGKPGCCAAVVPSDVVKKGGDKYVVNEFSVGRMEVCISDPTSATWKPEQFVSVLSDEYNVYCIQGAKRMIAGAAAAFGAFLVMQ